MRVMEEVLPMCMFSRPSVPAAPPAPPPTPVVTPQDPSVLARQDADRQRRAAAMGRASTLLTGGQGIANPNVMGGKTLLGS